MIRHTVNQSKSFLASRHAGWHKGSHSEGSDDSTTMRTASASKRKTDPAKGEQLFLGTSAVQCICFFNIHINTFIHQRFPNGRARRLKHLGGVPPLGARINGVSKKRTRYPEPPRAPVT